MWRINSCPDINILTQSTERARGVQKQSGQTKSVENERSRCRETNWTSQTQFILYDANSNSRRAKEDNSREVAGNGRPPKHVSYEFAMK